ncbi:small-conductance mechanosensitive channel MscS [Salmonella enterica]|uniref:Small-conductance mechanosensitive channel n=2 Tax=Salmonella enterica I TaxID=59201 RepID=A0A5U3G3N4_SALET|nr:small-conductance mechanosensitive channel MscS [Salmonella enterica]EBH9881927.1 small-conductance mechanosensitive channel MscS [Salmonella enterica subsp. enterica serovar Kisarawe]EBP4060338.1 small-conductance mechanosensitive channel MscS [Salmonella enterica subsp. enterica]AXD45506.1 mechanosensitive ion channel protein MscS [Salmonella enterica]EAA7569474.1 small-conductance mechanosensitive channel MscS [Salmonella enterica]EAS5878422.1 small-conductance mechanosensitive channel M
MEGFELFPKIKGAIKWMAEHSDSVIHFGWYVVAAIILLFIGKLIARLLSRGLEKLLLRRQVDATIVHFFSALVRYITIAFTAVAALGRIGIETSSIIAVIGAAGLAIGLALQGSLSNFAAGVLLVSLRPFRAGEIVQIGLVIGTVEKVHIFSTTLLTADSKEVVIPNGKIIADNIINYSRHPYRRIDLIIGVDYQSRIADVKNVIHRIIEQDHRIDKTRDITVRLGELAPSSLNFYVRVWVPNAQYWSTYYDLLENIKEAMDENGINIPYPRMDVRVENVKSITP